MQTIKISSLLLIISFLMPGACFSQEGYEELSKIGFVKDDNTSVRAGDNANFTSLCNLEKGDPVKIIGKRYSWYKVLLPKKAYVYIKKDFLGELAYKSGETEVNATNVNLRAGPDTMYAILGQVSKPEKIYVVAEEKGWCKIIPPKGTAGWIHSSHLEFSAEETEPESRKEAMPPAPLAVKKDTNVKLMLKQKETQGNLTISTQDK